MTTTPLRDLDAYFVQYEADGFGVKFRHLDDAHGAQGVMFRCPNPEHGHMILVWFANPIDPPTELPDDVTPRPRWTRVGSTLDDLTLTPSINSGCGGWHGFVTNGAAT